MSTGTSTGTSATPVTSSPITRVSLLEAILSVIPDGIHPVIEHIDEELRSVCVDLSERDNFLELTTPLTVAKDEESQVLPAEFRDFKELWIDEDNRLKFESYSWYRSKMSNNASPSKATPAHFSVHSGSFYWWPVADAAYTIQCEYYKHHTDSIATIEFDGKYRQAIFNGILEQLWSGRLSGLPGAMQQAAKFHSLYENKILSLQGRRVKDPPVVIYRDI